MEIGSVLELDNWDMYSIVEGWRKFRLPFMKDDTSYKSVFYQSGRNAIESLLRFLKNKQGIKRVLLPDYMCETVRYAAFRAGVIVDNYKIDQYYQFNVVEINNKLSQDTCLFIAHYFGKKPEAEILSNINSWKNKGIIVIEDITLSLFSVDREDRIGFGTYTLGSIRKWLPVPDGGFVASRTDMLPPESTNACISKYSNYYLMVQNMKREYIRGGCQDKVLKKIYMDYYSLSIKELFSDYEIYPMSDWTYNYLQNYDVAEVIKRRIKNYDYLYEKLSKINGINVVIQRTEGYVPLGMVIQVEKRDELLQYLIKNDIYCNVHWRLSCSEDNADLNYLSQHSITIPCDQRYNLEEINHIVNVLERW